VNIVTDDLVRAAAEAIGDAWDTEADDDERLEVYARAALAAVAPLIAAAEREQCAQQIRLKCGAHAETALAAIRAGGTTP
jgi:hypothetical protein